MKRSGQEGFALMDRPMRLSQGQVSYQHLRKLCAPCCVLFYNAFCYSRTRTSDTGFLSLHNYVKSVSFFYKLASLCYFVMATEDRLRHLTRYVKNALFCFQISDDCLLIYCLLFLQCSSNTSVGFQPFNLLHLFYRLTQASAYTATGPVNSNR